MNASTTALVYGIGITAEAVGDALRARGVRVLAADDRDSGRGRTAAQRWGTSLAVAPNDEKVRALVGAVSYVCPAPALPEHHPVVLAATAAGVPLVSELDLAYQWEQQRAGGPRPMLAITGTDGKTTTTLMTQAIVRAAGRRAAAVGNTEVPLVAELDSDAEVFVVECSSFRLHWIEHFRAEASAWLNLAEDHQNWHSSMSSYEQAKARLWRHVRPTDIAIGSAADPVVMRNLRDTPCHQRTVSGDGAGDYHAADGWLVGPNGPIVEIATMSRRLPHDITNALSAAALCLESDLATPDHVAAAMASFEHPPHRIEPVAEIGGVSWFNDSKATTPHAALTAIRSFERIVLLAGGRNKDLDLASLAGESHRLRAVVALGECAPLIEEIFADRVPTRRATSMADAVTTAAALARPGDTVLLSPACASFDWYPDGGYPARGDDFKRLVRKEAA